MFLDNIKPCAHFLIVFLILCAPINAFPAEKKQKEGVKLQKQYTQPISARRILKDFAADYKSPSDSKIIQTYTTGKVRNFNEARGSGMVPVQAHEVALVVRLTDCGIQMRDSWEVYYYKLENEWIFRDILQIKSKQISKPNKKLPAPGEPELKKLISDSLMKEYPGYGVVGITVLNAKGYWNLCTPMNKVTSRITLSARDDIYNTVTGHECVFTSIVARPETAWVHVKSGCVYKGKEAKRCHIGTYCLTISSESTVPKISDEAALSLLRASFEQEYSLRKNNVAVENFSIIRRLPHEDYGTKIPCIINTVCVIDENRNEQIYEAGTRKMGYKTGRAAYECAVYGHLKYSLLEKKWEAFIETCCTPENPQCGWPCSVPLKGCKRLGEK